MMEEEGEGDFDVDLEADGGVEVEPEESVGEDKGHDYRAAMEAAVMEMQKGRERELGRVRMHPQQQERLMLEGGGEMREHRDSLGFESEIDVSGDGELDLREGVGERGSFELMGGSGDDLGVFSREKGDDESVRRLGGELESSGNVGLMHSGGGDGESDQETSEDQMESQAVFGALTAAAVAVNVALQSISGAGSVGVSSAIDTSLDHRRFRKRKRVSDEDNDFIPGVLSTLADAEVVASLSMTDVSTAKKDMFVFDDVDWYQRPRSRRWWRRLFRVSKPTFEYICQLVKPDIESDTPASFQGIEGRVITVEKQVAIALRRLASGDSLTALGELFGVGESTVSKVIWKFVNSMEKRARHHMKWPEGVEMERVKAGFEVDHGLPNCCGVVDVTHILMELPGTESSVDWFDREQNYSMLVQVIVDMDMKIRDLFTGWPGSITDSRLLRNSGFYLLAEGGERLSGLAKTVQGIQVREYIIGDSGYPLLPWLINPYPTSGLSASRDSFNLKHASTKTVVEDALGRLKGAWKILHKVLWRPDIRKLPSIVLVCCLLHNIMLEAEEEMEDGVALVGHHDEGYRQQWCLSVEPEGDLMREALAEHAFVNVHD